MRWKGVSSMCGHMGCHFSPFDGLWDDVDVHDVYIVDVGPLFGECNAKRAKTFVPFMW